MWLEYQKAGITGVILEASHNNHHLTTEAAGTQKDKVTFLRSHSELNLVLTINPMSLITMLYCHFK